MASCSRQSVQPRQGGRGTGSNDRRQENVQQPPSPTNPVDSPLWKYVTKIGKKEKKSGGGTYLWNCNMCKKNFTGSYTRVKAHFLWLLGDNGVHHCKSIKRNDVEAFQAEQDAADLAKLERRSRLPPSSKRGGEVPLIVEEARKRQSLGTLAKMFDMGGRDETDNRVSRAIYACGLPFNVVRSPYWQDMLKAVNEAPRGYKGPNFEKVRTTLLRKEKLIVEKILEPVRFNWSSNGVSIISDGWTDTANRPLINIIVMSPSGPYFLRAIDASGEEKTAEWIAEKISESIELVGPSNVVQVITDNARSCKAAGAIIEGLYDHIFWTPCVVHSLNLAFKSIVAEVEWMKTICEEAREVQIFITNHQHAQAMYREFARLQLLKVGETRFASHYIMLKRLVEMRDGLSSMVVSPQWQTWKQSNSEKSMRVRGTILDEAWWVQAELFVSIMEPLVDLLKLCDSDVPMLGDIYEGTDRMLERIQQLLEEKDPVLFGTIKDIIISRWNKYNTPLHALSYALNPKYYDEAYLAKFQGKRKAPNKDNEVANGFRTVISKICSDPMELAELKNQFTSFITGSGAFGNVNALSDRGSMAPLQWWGYYGAETPELQTLASRVLSQVCSSSVAERNWSTYEFIHSVKRNKLQSAKAEDLVYIHSNLRLISRSKADYSEGPSKLWDVNPEDADLDTPDCLMANLSLASSADPFVMGDLDAPMPRSGSSVPSSSSIVGGQSGSRMASSSRASGAAYHQSRELDDVPLEDVQGDDYLSD